ncbi:MAG: hypothetical protein V1816_06400 [Pseudomonadota bacterium]
MIDVKTVFDGLETRCPRLGGPVPFDYCRKTDGGLPCPRSLVCWETAFPVREYMVRVLSADEWTRVFENPPGARLDSILKAAAAVGPAGAPKKPD